MDVARHPEITFNVRGAKLRGGGQAQVDGELTVHGVSRPRSLAARLTRADGGAVTLETEFTVDREEFGITWNRLGMMRGAATVTATLRFTRTTG
jgi:polyisoprenoid-binding protein YceI